MAIINGKYEEINDVNLLDYLIKNKYRVNRVVVDLNGNIIKKVDRENILSIVGDVEIVVEAFDVAETKAMAIEELLINGDKKLVSASGMAGLSSANEIITRKVRDNFYLIGDNYSDYEEYSGIMSTRVMICAAHQANVVLRLILGEENER